MYKEKGFVIYLLLKDRKIIRKDDNSDSLIHAAEYYSKKNPCHEYKVICCDLEEIVKQVM